LANIAEKFLAGLGADVIKIEPLGGEKTAVTARFTTTRNSFPTAACIFWPLKFWQAQYCPRFDLTRAHVSSWNCPDGRIIVDTRARDLPGRRGIGYDAIREPQSVH